MDRAVGVGSPEHTAPRCEQFADKKSLEPALPAIDAQLPSILVTGGAGFIGGCFVRRLHRRGDRRVVNLDKLTYAGCLDSVPAPDPLHYFVQGDIGDAPLVLELLETHRPRWVVNFAAESHVDRSIDSPAEFVETNVKGTTRLLDAVTHYWRGLVGAEQNAFRFLHVSTDEVYGSLGPEGASRETDPCLPNSPYAASKAAADLFVRAYRETYGVPTLVSNSSNNYGPYQFPEKLIPLMTLNALAGKPLPVYGDGSNVRDWLHVEDHCEALEAILERGRVGETYNVGGGCERRNLDLVKQVCAAVDRLRPGLPHAPCEQLITFVADRPGHDQRYAVDTTKISTELGWRPRHDFDAALERTVAWCLENPAWFERLNPDGWRRDGDNPAAPRLG